MIGMVIDPSVLMITILPRMVGFLFLQRLKIHLGDSQTDCIQMIQNLLGEEEFSLISTLATVLTALKDSILAIDRQIF